MNELKPIPKKIYKADVYEMYADEKSCIVTDAIRIAKQHINKQSYNANDKKVSFRELKYIVAQLDNPRDFVQVLTFNEIKELQKELE